MRKDGLPGSSQHGGNPPISSLAFLGDTVEQVVTRETAYCPAEPVVSFRASLKLYLYTQEDLDLVLSVSDRCLNVVGVAIQVEELIHVLWVRG